MTWCSFHRSCLLGIAAGACFVGAAKAQLLPEELRFQGELQACAALPEAEQKPCEDRVRAKIRDAWKARIEEQARRRQPN